MRCWRTCWIPSTESGSKLLPLLNKGLFFSKSTPHHCCTCNHFVAVLTATPVSARESLASSVYPLFTITHWCIACQQKCKNRQNLTPETTKTHWNHTSTISWHIITWLTKIDFSIEEWRECAVFRPLQSTTGTSGSLPGSRQLSPVAVCLAVDNCRQRYRKG